MSGTAEALAALWGLRADQVVLSEDVPVGHALFVQKGVFPARVLPNRHDRRRKGGEGHGR